MDEGYVSSGVDFGKNSMYKDPEMEDVTVDGRNPAPAGTHWVIVKHLRQQD